jgi:hypothetical protein
MLNNGEITKRDMKINKIKDKEGLEDKRREKNYERENW